jgi:hypothetical protein
MRQSSRLTLSDETRQRLKDCNAAYVNSEEHLHLLQEAGLPRTCQIRTTSPYMAAAFAERADRLGSEIPPEGMVALYRSIDAASQDLEAALKEPFGDGIALNAAITLINLQRVIYDALLIRPDDLHYPVCIPNISGSNDEIENVLQFHWPALVKKNPNAVIPEIFVDHTTLPYVYPPVEGFWKRLAHTNLGSIVFRLQISGRLRPLTGRTAPILYCRHSPDLLKDAGLQLWLKNIALSKVDNLASVSAEDGDDSLSNAVAENAITSLQALLARIGPDDVRQEATSLIRKAVYNSTTGFLIHERAAERAVGDIRKKTKRAGLTFTSITSSRDIALSAAFQKKGWPVFTFSHGATRRISAHQDRNHLLHETYFSDIYFSFTGQGASPFGSSNRGREIIVGAPDFYHPRRNWLWRPKRREIWYVSSALYMGAEDKLHRAMSDHMQCAFETGIVRDILGKCGKTVVFKPYPALRYLDEDPVIAQARKSGLTVYDNGTDLRYEMHRPAVLIVSRSGSTVGYGLCQDIPLIYIEAPGRGLDDAIRDAFYDSVFVFDAQSEDFQSQLREFLSLPQAEIETRWQAKAPARRALIDEVVSSSKGGPRAVANTINTTLRHAV